MILKYVSCCEEPCLHATDLKSLRETRQTIGTSQGPSQRPLEGHWTGQTTLLVRIPAAMVLVVRGQTTVLVTTSFRARKPVQSAG